MKLWWERLKLEVNPKAKQHWSEDYEYCINYNKTHAVISKGIDNLAHFDPYFLGSKLKFCWLVKSKPQLVIVSSCVRNAQAICNLETREITGHESSDDWVWLEVKSFQKNSSGLCIEVFGGMFGEYPYDIRVYQYIPALGSLVCLDERYFECENQPLDTGKLETYYQFKL